MTKHCRVSLAEVQILGSMDAEEFRAHMTAMNASLHAMARLLGIAQRRVAEYRKDSAIPRVVALAVRQIVALNHAPENEADTNAIQRSFASRSEEPVCGDSQIPAFYLIGNRKFPFIDFTLTARAYQEFIADHQLGASASPQCNIVNNEMQPIAFVSYNGRVWRGTYANLDERELLLDAPADAPKA